MYKEIIEQENLTCTEEQFEKFFNSIDLSQLKEEMSWVKVEIKTFDEKYNNIQIENPANGKYYYIMDIQGMVFLQNIVPYVWWLNWLNDDNIDEVIENHKNNIINDFINSEKMKLTINNFK